MSLVEAAVRQYNDLHITRGRKVLEVRPKVQWDKGRALAFLMEHLGVSTAEDVLPLYIGDDRTDEDAFKVLRERKEGGMGILVSTKVKETHAVFSVRAPHEVGVFLRNLVAWGFTESNGWIQRGEQSYRERIADKKEAWERNLGGAWKGEGYGVASASQELLREST